MNTDKTGTGTADARRFTPITDREYARKLPRYRSSIPKDSKECVTERHPDGRPKTAEYKVGSEVVGRRQFHEEGWLAFEVPFRDGVRHGTVYRWDEPGILGSEEPWRDGVARGITRQWGRDGSLLGSYEMGKGIDLWWNEGNGRVWLSEARHYGKGFQGYEWFINSDQKTVSIERNWQEDKQHGIEREWAGRRMCRGFPRFWILDRRVTKRQYLAACRHDASLPRYQAKDNRPERTFPPAIQKHLIIGGHRR